MRQATVATLANKVYVIKNYTEEEKYISVGNFKIEREILHPGASPKGLKNEKSELILFPYHYSNGELIRYTDDEFKRNFPEATKYLLDHIDTLANRKADKSTNWFEYGRTQALLHLNQNKLLISIVITNCVNVYELNNTDIPYAGIYIVPKGELSLEKAKEILESSSFYEYIKGIGINASGKSLRITAKDINSFEFE